jgi:hypothetical protein
MSRDNVKVGDHVVVRSGYGDGVRLSVVQRVTKTTVTIGDDVYSISTGRLRGSSTWSGSSFELYVPEQHNGMLERSRLLRRVRAARKALEAMTITAENIDKIETLIKEITP